MKNIIFLLILFLLIRVQGYSQVPQPPILISPPDSSQVPPYNVLLDWSDVPTATSYRVQVSLNSFFTALIIDETTNISQYTMLTGVGSWCYWRVNATNQYGTGLWSNVFSFHGVINPPGVPLIICDTSNVPLTPILDWWPIPTTTYYRVQVSTSPTFTSTIINEIITISQYTVPSGILNYSSHYYWRVNATNSSGTSPWSSVCAFTTVGSSGIRIISSEVPTENKLYNNFPNPFNPNTNIKYEVAPVGQRLAFDVKLVVYDILGKEIATLINEKLQPGTYEVTFDGSNLNSGVYFYRLTTEGFSETKQMILIK